jgi:anti-anti-sigma factor
MLAHIEEAPTDDVDVFVLEGEFDASNSPELAKRFEAAIERGDYDFVIDMCGVSFVDVSTLNVIVRAMKLAYQHNGHLAVACAQRHVLRAIDLAGLRHAVRVYESRQEAFAHLRDRAS